MSEIEFELCMALQNCMSLLRAYAGPDDEVAKVAITEAENALAKARGE